MNVFAVGREKLKREYGWRSTSGGDLLDFMKTQKEIYQEKLEQITVKEWLDLAYIEIDLDGNILVEGNSPDARRRLKLKSAINELAERTDGSIDLDMEISKLAKVEKMLIACANKIKQARLALKSNRPNEQVAIPDP